MKPLKLFILLLMLIFNASALSKSIDDLRKLKDNFENEHRIQLLFEEIPFSVHKIHHELLTDDDYDDLYDYILLLDGELKKYPRFFVRRNTLKTISLVKYLTNSGWLSVAALPDSIRKILFLDIRVGIYNKIYQKHVIHHDMFHMIEKELIGDTKNDHSKWRKYNSPKVKYGKTGWAGQTKNAGVMNHPEPGFTTKYAKSEIGENKAEIFAHLFVKEEYEKLMKWTIEDKLLLKKVNHIKAFLYKHDKNFNAQYWDKLHD